MPDQIFISYRRDDAAYVTGHINDLLRKEFGNRSVFTDVDNIALGVDFRRVLDDTVSQCQVLLAVIGDHWLTVTNQDGKPRLQDPADFVRIEIESALRRNIPVIPLLVGHATMPQVDDLPDSLKDLAFRNGTPIRPAPDFNADMDRLIRNLRRYLHAVREDETSEPAPGEKKAKPAAQTDVAKRSDKSRGGFRVEDEDRALHQAEFGTGRRPAGKRWRTRLWVLATILIAGGAWYYVDRNPDAVQAVMSAIQPDATDAVDEIQAGADAGVGAPTSFGAPATETADTPEAAIEDAPDGNAPSTVEVDPAAGEPGAVAGAGESDDALQAADDTAAEPVDGAADAEATAVSNAASPDGMVEGEVVLTPGTQRQADASTLISEGVSLAALGDHEAAVQNFSEALQLDVEAAFVYRQRGASYQALHHYEDAIRDYDEAIRLNADDLNAYYNRGASHAALGDFAAAVADYDEVIRLDPEFADAYLKRADAHEALGNSTAAAQDRATAGIFESNRGNPR